MPGVERPGDHAMLRQARVARLATADARGHPHVIPICFVFDGRAIYTVVDEKPKRASPKRLRRIRNIAANPSVAVVVDHYDEDWARLRYVLVLGTARVIEAGDNHARALALLQDKYPQYRAMRLAGRPMIKITPRRIVAWAAAPAQGRPGRPRSRTSKGGTTAT